MERPSTKPTAYMTYKKKHCKPAPVTMDFSYFDVLNIRQPPPNRVEGIHKETGTFVCSLKIQRAACDLQNLTAQRSHENFVQQGDTYETPNQANERVPRQFSSLVSLAHTVEDIVELGDVCADAEAIRYVQCHHVLSVQKRSNAKLPVCNVKSLCQNDKTKENNGRGHCHSKQIKPKE